MFESIASLVTRRGYVVAAGWVLVAAVLYAVAPAWESVSKDDDVRFFPKDYPSVIGQELLERGFPQDSSSSQVVLIAERPDRVLGRDDFAYVERMAVVLETLRKKEPGLGIKQVTDYRARLIGPRLVKKAREGPGQAVLTNVSLNSTFLSKRARMTVDEIKKELKTVAPGPPEGLNLAMTGSAVVGHDQNESSKSSINTTWWATIALVVVILLVVYRSPLLALIPLVTIALSVWISLMGMPLLTRVPGLHFQVINVTKVFVIVVLFGAGTDYCLFLIARYREELARGRGGNEALIEAIKQVGGALLASAGTVIVGLGMLYFSMFAKVRFTGPAIALSLAVSLAAAMTLAPVLLRWLRGAVFWPFRPPHHEKGADRDAEGQEETPMFGFWAAVADRVVRRPGLILAVSLLALAPLAIIGAQTRSNFSQLSDLGKDQPSIIGAGVIRKYFEVGELSPTTVLIAHPSLDFRTPTGQNKVDELSRKLATIPGVAEVRSVSQPLGKPLAGLSGLERFLPAEARKTLERTLREGREKAEARYVSTVAKGADRDHITRIDLIFTTDPFSELSLGSLEAVRHEVEGAVAPGGIVAGASEGLAGASVQIDDLKNVISIDEKWMYVRVTLGVYLILVLLLRRPWICLYLIATVVLGYLASLGLTELVFRSLHEGPEPWVGLDWKVGFFLFVILVAVGEDYNIFLMSRVIEEERKHGPIEGTRRAVAYTGGIISSCGLIMAGTFASMLTGTLKSLQELGFALGLGVLLDTFIVRPILVPAFLVLLHRGRGDKPSNEAPKTIDRAEATLTP